MPDWKGIIDTFMLGKYGERAQDYKAKQQGMEMEQERMGLARNADSRAAAGEARAQDTFEFGQSQRPLIMKQLQSQVDAGEISLKDAQNKLALFDAEGGVEGAAGRNKIEFDRKGETHAQNIKQSNATIGNMAADNARAAGADQRAAQRDQLAVAAQKIHNEILEATKGAQITGANQANDPAVKDAQKLANLVRYSQTAPDSEIEWIAEEIKRLSVSNEVRKLGGQAANAANPDAFAGQPDPLGKRGSYR